MGFFVVSMSWPLFHFGTNATYKGSWKTTSFSFTCFFVPPLLEGFRLAEVSIQRPSVEKMRHYTVVKSQPRGNSRYKTMQQGR